MPQDREGDENLEHLGLDDDDFELNDGLDFDDLGPDDLIDDEDFGLKEAFGLPDRLPPVRLPAEPELAAMARTSPLLARARRLAQWAPPDIEITDDAELNAADTVAAARELGIALAAQADAGPEPLPGMPDLPPSVTSMRDVPELARLWDTALDVGFLELDLDTGRAQQGEDMASWPDGTDEDVLDFWSTALPSVLDRLEDEALLDERAGELLDFTGAGLALMIMLFLARQEGVPAAEVSSIIRDAATDELAPSRAAKAWKSWTRAHGDPAEYLLGLLAELGVVWMPEQPSADSSEDSQAARLTPLGTWAFRQVLIDHGVEVPLLPPPDEMTAADLVGAMEDLDEEEMAAETAAWLEPRPPDAAAAELLAVAANGDAAERMFAVAIAQKLGAAAEAAWRDALARPELRPYAKIALTEIAGGEPGVTALPGLEPDMADIAWVITDTLAALSDAPEELPEQISEAIPPGQEQYVFDAMARSPHPDAAAVLSLVGKLHPDKRIAKAARGSAHRARTRPRPVS